jgi:hypothetical protein
LAIDSRRSDRQHESLTIFSGAARIVGVYPLQFSFLRRKLHTQRRYDLPIVNPLLMEALRFSQCDDAMANLAQSPHYGARRRGSRFAQLF